MRIMRSGPMMVVTLAALSFTGPESAAGQVNAVPLPELLVDISQDHCPIERDQAATEALAIAATRYDLAAALAGRLEVQVRSAQRRVSAQEVAQRTEALSTTAMRRGSVQQGRELWLGRLRQGVFAVPLETSSFDGRHEAWEYPPLHADLAYYFLTEDFVGAHDIAFLDDSRRVLGFCPRDQDETFIDGRIVLDDTGRIDSVDWAFHTRRLQEGAGGSVQLDGPLPLPLRSFYWRRLPTGDYAEWTDDYLAWSVSGL